MATLSKVTPEITVQPLMLKDGLHDVAARVYTNLDENDAGIDSRQILFMPGHMANVRVLDGVARRTAGSLAAAGERVRLTTYDEPVVGATAYAESYRQERLAKVAAQVGQEGPLHLVGHSWSWIVAVRWVSALSEADRKERIAGMAGYTPAGEPAQPGYALSPEDFMRNLVVEATHIIRSWRNTASVTTTTTLLANFVRHVQGHPRAARDLIATILSTDVTAEATALHAGGMPLGMVLAAHDGFCRPAWAQDRLGPVATSARTIPTSHLGAVIRHRFGADLAAEIREKIPLAK